MTGLIFLRQPVIHLFFEHGAFSAQDTAATAGVLLAFALGLWAFAGYRILATCFYSLQDTKTPATVAILGMGTNLVFALLLMKPLEYRGLALAAALAAMVNTGTRIRFAPRLLPGRVCRLPLPMPPIAAVTTAAGSGISGELTPIL